MSKDGCSCGCIISLFIGALVLWGVSCSIAIEWDQNPVIVFIGMIVLLGLLAFLLAYLLGKLGEHLNLKDEKRFNYIQNKYPKAFARYLVENGQSDPSKATDSFKRSVLKRQEIIWENEEIAINNEEKAAIKKKEDEKQAEVNRQLGEIEKLYPNGLKIWKGKNPNCSSEFLIRNKFYIENEESIYQTEQKRRKQAEEKAKAEMRISLQSNARQVLLENVQNWETLYNNFHYTWLFYYYPVSCDFSLPFLDNENRRTVWNFKNDPERNIMPAIHERAMDLVIPQIKKKLTDTFGEEYVQFLTLVCIPASTNKKNIARYEEFSSQLCAGTGMDNGYPHTYITKDGISKNDPNNTSGYSIQPEVRFDDWFRGKNVLLFDDIVTKGGTMLRYKDMLERKGAIVIGGIALGKTKHEKPEQQRYVYLDEDIPLF